MTFAVEKPFVRVVMHNKVLTINCLADLRAHHLEQTKENKIKKEEKAQAQKQIKKDKDDAKRGKGKGRRRKEEDKKGKGEGKKRKKEVEKTTNKTKRAKHVDQGENKKTPILGCWSRTEFDDSDDTFKLIDDKC
jgi:hypothetical protein